jgi:sigma-54 dependent transcriptional regulator, acetoin dehydrogenase operon transcriptional activator AcoR
MDSFPQSESPDFNLRLQSAQVYQLFSHARFAALGSVTGSVILAASLWTAAPHVHILTWILPYWFIHLLRQLLVAKFYRKSPTAAEAPTWEKWFKLGASLGTLWWGLAAIFLFPSGSIGHQFILVVCVSGIVAAATVLFAPTNCYVPCVACGMFPLATRFLYEAKLNQDSLGHIYTEIGLAIILFTAMLVFLGRRVHLLIADGLSLKIQTESLIESLRTEKDASEALNNKLKREVFARERAEDRLRELLREMERRVEERTVDLAFTNVRLVSEIESRKVIECELLDIKEGLEIEVARRTEDLHKANKQLTEELAWRKVAHARLEESSKLQKMLIESAKDIIWIRDLDLHLTYISPSVSHVLGYTVEEAMNMPPMSIVTPESAEHIQQALEHELRLDATRSPDEFEGRTLEMEVIKKDGSTMWAEFTATFLRDPEGAPIGMLGISRDISNRKRMEKELRNSSIELEKRVQERTLELAKANETLIQRIEEIDRIHRELKASEQLFRTALDAAQNCMFIKDEKLAYSKVNPAMLSEFGFNYSQIIGKTDDEVFGPSKSNYINKLEERVLGGETIEIEHLVKKGDAVRLFHCSRAPLKDSSGKIIGIFGSGWDITDEMPWKVQKRISTEETVSPIMRATIQEIVHVATTDCIVLFLGESGSGKDHFSRYLHQKSHRSAGPFFEINCAALPAELAESELFGHEAGAFTGAHGRKRGLLELAGGGSILLNEIGELSLPLQAKLLTFLDTQTFTRVGGEKTISVDTRIIAATNRDLPQEAQAGRFRQDLFYRIAVVVIKIPPLREHREDIPILAGDLAGKIAKKLGRQNAPTLTSGAVEMLMSYSWPGNVRELKNVLERALILSPEDSLSSKHIKMTGMKSETEVTSGLSVSLNVSEAVSMMDELERAKSHLISLALQRCGGNMSSASRLLGVPRTVLRHHLKKTSETRGN